MNQMSTTSNDEHWLKLITQCRSSGLTDHQWCIENGIPVSTCYYHVRALRKKACEFPEVMNSAAVSISTPSICLEMQSVCIEIYEQAGADVLRDTLLALRQLC